MVLVGIEDLDFVQTHQVDAAVAASLATAFDLFRRGPFDVDLAIAEGLLGLDIVLVRDHIAIT